MCLVVLALNTHPRYPLVLAANRDEYHARTAESARWREQGPLAGMLAGRDLAAGGTWLGMRRDGRIALVTNVRDGAVPDPAARSRGDLVPRALQGEAPPDGRYNGFNLLAGDERALYWRSNRSDEVRRIDGGVHGLSNALLDVPWPKVVRTQARLRAWLVDEGDDVAPLFEALADRRPAADAELPSTGVTLAWERLLSSPFIVSDAYGTRCSTVVTIDREGTARFVERSYAPDGSATGDVDFTWRIGRATSAPLAGAGSPPP